MNIKIAIVAALVLILSSCDFLEVETVGRTTMPNFFSDVPGLKAGLSGSYSKMYGYYSSEFYKYPDVAGNMVDLNNIGNTVEMIDQFNFTSDAEQEVGAVGYIWRKVLEALANVNNVLEYAPPLIEQYPNKSDIELAGWALFLRALCPFDLFLYISSHTLSPDITPWLPVLLMTPVRTLPSRATAAQVFDQIIKDLQDAETLFGDEPMKDAYHASKESVWALLSRVYLYKEDWNNSILYSSKVINRLSLARGSDYLEMYHNLVPGKETILRFNGLLKSKSLNNFYSAKEPIAMAADTLLSLFSDANDLRLKLFTPDKNNQLKITTKYRIMVDYTPEQEHYDPFVLRVSEMYLNRAEAYARIGEFTKSLADLKEIIARALNKNVEDLTINYQGVNELMQLIKIETSKRA